MMCCGTGWTEARWHPQTFLRKGSSEWPGTAREMWNHPVVGWGGGG